MFFPPQIKPRRRLHDLGDLGNFLDQIEDLLNNPGKAFDQKIERWKNEGWIVWRPFGGHIYSYPVEENGNETAMFGLYGFVGLVIGALSFSVLETFVILALALYDTEAKWWSESLPTLPHANEASVGISGVNGWLAGHNLAQIFFKERRNVFNFGGLAVLYEYTKQWLDGEEGISHAAHFQTMGAGILSAIVLRNNVRSKPVKMLRDHALLIASTIFIWGVWIFKSWLKMEYPSPDA